MCRIFWKQIIRYLSLISHHKLLSISSVLLVFCNGLTLTLFTSSSENPVSLRRFEFAEHVMGTTARIVLYAPDEQHALEASKAAFEKMAMLEGIMSDYRPESELNQLCRNALGSPKPVSPDLFEVLSESQGLAENTGGAFDVTVGPVVQLWRRARRQKELLTPDRLAEARKLVGHQKLQLDPSSQTACLLIPGMKLDLGGIAKGYAADQALNSLQGKGVAMALVVIGGDIALGAPPPEKSGWRVEINPGPAFKSKLFKPLLLSHAGVSTSGDAEQFVEISGTRYSHIVDPRTGVALTGFRSVTVVAPNATTSDALATTLCVMGPKTGFRFIQSQPHTEVLYLEVVDGKIRSYTSRRWKALEARE
jgi:thiamine biosynthesis lipoprotein